MTATDVLTTAKNLVEAFSNGQIANVLLTGKLTVALEGKESKSVTPLNYNPSYAIMQCIKSSVCTFAATGCSKSTPQYAAICNT
jgi:hypothetical protein